MQSGVMAKNGTVVDFFLVGAAKAGTTSVYRILDSHPDIFMSTPKETNFFTRREVRQHAFLNKLRIVSSKKDYELIFSRSTPSQILGEGSVSYLAYTGVAKRIFDHNPDAKIIISLRDPVMRAVSHHLMDSRLGYCKHSLQEIFRSPSKYPDHFFQYFDCGLYFARVKEYIDVFSRENVHIILYPDLAHDQKVCAAGIFAFLNVDPCKTHKTTVRENVRKEPKNSVYSFLYQRRFLRALVKHIASPKYLATMESKFFRPGRRPEVSESLIGEIYDFYSNDINKLEQLLNMDMKKIRRFFERNGELQ